MKYPLPEIGRVFDVPYPFVKDTRIEHYDGADGPETDEVPTWNPGVRMESCDVGHEYSHTETWAEADAMGSQILTVVGVYRPGRFPTRVFFTRRWRDPDGRVFGKGLCRSLTVPAFTELTRGYRHPFEVRQASSEEPPASKIENEQGWRQTERLRRRA